MYQSGVFAGRFAASENVVALSEVLHAGLKPKRRSAVGFQPSF